jgi:hypothetical protein
METSLLWCNYAFASMNILSDASYEREYGHMARSSTHPTDWTGELASEQVKK